VDPEVLLVADGVPVVFARSLVPTTSIPAAWHLAWFGRAAAGQRIVQRSPGAAFAPGRRVDARIPAGITRRATGVPICPLGRRSAFRRQGSPLLITEVFLPAIRNLTP
jgi:chorismate--pyruvate lyase